MNELIEELTAEALKKTLIFVEGTKDFVAEQTPLLVREILTLGLIEASVNLIFWMIVAFLLYKLHYNLKKYLDKVVEESIFESIWNHIDEGFHALGVLQYVFLGSSILAVLISATIQGTKILMICFTPRIYILEQLRILILNQQ